MLLFVSMMVSTSARMPITLDEYTFYRLAGQFPNYSTTSQWFYKDEPNLIPNKAVISEAWYTQALHLQYDTPIFVHLPLPIILMSPIVKGLNALADNGVLPHIEGNYTKGKAETMTFILRLIPIALIVASMWLIFNLLWKKVGNYAYLFAVVPAASQVLMTGSFLFYWDVFMMFFFVLTLYLAEKNSKWQYVAACCLVNTKIFIGVLMLLPLLIKNWRLVFSVLAMIPFYIATVVVTGQPFYLLTHYLAQMGVHNWVYEYWVSQGIWNYVWNLGVPFYVLLSLPIVFFWKKYPVYSAFWVAGTLYAWGSGLGITHLSTVIYIGALSFPFVAYELKLIERIKLLLGQKAVAV